MAENPFKKLANKLATQNGDVAQVDGSHLTEVLQEHLDMIAAAHSSNHGSSHYSKPNVEIGV